MLPGPRDAPSAPAESPRYGSFVSPQRFTSTFPKPAIFPSLLHQDPRYFQSGQGRVKRQILYAVVRIFVTRSDSGQSQPNYSEFLGSSTAAVISTYLYHPKEDRDLSTAASVWASEVGFDTLNNLIKEFWPDIRRKLHR